MLAFFFVFWLILNARVTLEIVLFGIAIAAVIFLFARKMFGYGIRTETFILRNLPLLILYVFNLIIEIIKASLAVMKIVVSGHDSDPVIVEFNSGFKSGVFNTILANSITLTPGTYTVFQEDGHFTIHCLSESFSAGLDDSSFIHLLRKMTISEGEATEK
ncbi:MAG: Na+/H+ antiporter subunit E [Lachnospiraceae bacterium]|nr:Na+/H+ antiporter subunit E [Lachnospiraceae bacterium]